MLLAELLHKQGLMSESQMNRIKRDHKRKQWATRNPKPNNKKDFRVSSTGEVR
jgi:hypothetical protein